MNILANNFNSGEISPLVSTRVDQPRRNSGCEELVNFLPRVFGGAQRRPGTEYRGMAKGDANVRLIPFQFSTTTAYVIEAGPLYFRFWKQDGSRILDVEDNPFEVISPYSAGELSALKFAQANDIMYFVHPAHPVHKLSRLAEGNWTFSAVDFGADGNWPPFRDPNVQNITITPTKDPAANGVNWKYVTHSGGTTTALTIRAYFAAGGAALSSGTNTQPKLGLTSSPAEASNNFGYYVTTWLKVVTTGTYIFKTTADDTAAIWINGTLVVNKTGNSLGTASGSISLASGYHFVELAYCQISSTKQWNAATAFVWDPPDSAEAMVPTASQYLGFLDTGLMTANADIFYPEHIGAFWLVGHDRLSPVVKLDLTSTGTSSVFRVMGDWSLTTGGTWHGKLYVERSADGSTNWQTIRFYESLQNSTRNIAANGREEKEAFLRLRLVDGTGTDAGNPYAILEAGDPVIYSLARITGVGGSPAANVAAVEWVNGLYAETATTNWAEGAWSNVRGFPETVTFHEQRLIMTAGQRIHGSVIGDWENFRLSSLDDAALDFLLGSTQSHDIRWLASIAGALLVGTNADEWVIDPGESGSVLTPSTTRIRRESSYGSGAVDAVIANDALLFLQRNGRKWRELVYSLEKDGYIAPDLNLMSEHILGAGCREAALQRQDDTILWCVLEDGTLSSLTYERQQEVVAWARHDTAGEFLSVCVLAGGENEPDQVWLAVHRALNAGSSNEVEGIFIERFHPESMIWRSNGSPGKCFVDCATVATGTPEEIEAARFNGGALTGSPEQKVVLVLDGKSWSSTPWHATDAVALPEGTGFAAIGLPYSAKNTPSFPYPDLQDGSSFGRLFRVNAVEVHYRDAREFTLRVRQGRSEFHVIDCVAWPLVEGVTVSGFTAGDLIAAPDLPKVNANYRQVTMGTWKTDSGEGVITRDPDWWGETWSIGIDGEDDPLVTSSSLESHPAQVSTWQSTLDPNPDVPLTVTRSTFREYEAESYSGSKEIMLTTGIEPDQAISIVVDQPFPFYLTAVVYKIEAYGQ